MNKLLQRVVTAVVLLAVLLLVFFRLPPPAAVGLIGAFISIAAWEWSGFLGTRAFAGRATYVLALMLGMAGSVWLIPAQVPLLPMLWLSLAWWGCAFVWLLYYPTRIRPEIGALCGFLVIIPAWAAIVALLSLPERGAEYVLFVLVLVWAADIGAYFVGRRFGRRKLAPQVSPGKTWEGFVGGLAASAGAAVAGAWWFGLPALQLLAVGLTVGAISVVGDLTVSMFKRNAGLKDSGNLFPGHGGVLDRVDSVTAAVPLFALEFIWLGWLGP